MNRRFPLHTKGVLSGALLLCIGLTFNGIGADSIDVDDIGQTRWVKQVPDGDSLVLRDGSQIRLIGINAPEFGKKGQAPQPLARAARNALAKLAQDQKLILVRDNQAHDRYRRLLMHAYLPDGRNVQEILLRLGLAWHVAIPPNLENLERYRKAEAEARAADRGVWRPGLYPAIEAAKIDSKDTGFHRVQGQIQRHWESNEYHFFALAPNLSLRIARADWHHFDTNAAALVQRSVIARGWISERDGKLSLRLGHPSMLELLP